jgi:primosomal protein N' (replication factor Y) (superfamily II helicase)
MPSSPELADIILPLQPDRLFTYLIPEEMGNIAQKGMRAIVQFGARKYYTGIIKRIHRSYQEGQEYKSISSLPDDNPIVNEFQFAFWDWLSDYYLCSPGEVYKAAIPSGLKLESVSKILYNEDFNATSTGNPRLDNILEIIRNHSAISLADLSRITGKKEVMTDVKNLLAIEAVYLEENMKERFKPKKEKMVSLSSECHSNDLLNKTLDSLSHAPKQKEALLKFLDMAGDDIYGFSTSLKSLIVFSSHSVISGLVKRGVFVFKEVVLPLEESLPSQNTSLAILNDEQVGAIQKIKTIFEEKEVCLLHGVTSSGKTELYIHLIAETIQQGKQVLYLLPEIALTSQIIERLRKVFGEKAGIYHSRFSDSERVSVYNRVLSPGKDAYNIILGVRSSVFLPYSNLGLIIIDEEHENTFKQHDPAPRYHARDAAIVLASIHKAKVLLGTATPSVETWANCQSGKFGLVELKNRYGDIKMPEILISNTREARRKNKMKSVFTPILLKEMELTLSSGKQVILFQNRRGYSSYLECESCGHIPHCKTCDVSLTYHKYTGSLVCHYCGYTRRVPGKCDECGSTRLITRGFGTELVKDDIELLFPSAKIARLDLDSSRTIKSYEKILHDFAAGKTNILVGTQMLSKGLDFDSVGLVGILNADQMLNYPDFRAYERAFQLMMQVSGRAGRREERGKVVIQTSDPGNPVIKYVRDHDFKGFFKDQYSERQMFNYPPLVRMIRISLKHKRPTELRDASELLAREMRAVFGNRVLGPQEPIIAKIQSYYIRNILLKIEKKAPFGKARNLLRPIIEDLKQNKGSSLKIHLDVDPA